MLNVPRFLLISSLVGVSYCCHIQDISKDISSDDDYYNAFIFPWLVVIDDTTEHFATLYGGLIHPKAVLTSADHLEGHEVNNLIVVTNCDEDMEDASLQNCTTRNVMKIIYSDDYDGQPTPEKSYALLILTTPFDITPTISTVNLIDSMELVDKQSCFVTHWLRVHDIRNDKFGLVTEAFQVPYFDGNFSIDAMDEDQLEQSFDYVIQKQLFTPMIFRDKMHLLAFFGSPLVCYDENQTPYQVGIATFGIGKPDHEYPKPFKRIGSLFLIPDYYDEIMKKLEENVS